MPVLRRHRAWSSSAGSGARRHRRIRLGQDARWRASSPGCCRPRAGTMRLDGARAGADAWRRAAWKSCAASRSSSRRPTRRSTRRTASSASWRGRCLLSPACRAASSGAGCGELLDLVKLPHGLARSPARRAVGRPEAARQPRARAGGRARPDPVRRGDVGARHRGRCGDPRPAGGAAPRARRVADCSSATTSQRCAPSATR